MRQLDEYHVLDYLSEHYEVLHTQSRQWLMEDIDEFIKLRKGGDRMKLYHGSLEVVDKPVIREQNRTLDYGNGFYTTTSYQQAEDWVRRRMKEQKAVRGFINVFDFVESSLNELNCLVFEEPTEEWWIL